MEALAAFQNKKRKERDKKVEKQGKKRKNKIIHIFPPSYFQHVLSLLGFFLKQN